MSDLNFSSLAIPDNQIQNLKSMGYQQLTPIQSGSLPIILEGKDVIVQGETGSGKTVAFGLGLLQAIDVSQLQVQAMVLCPTRELADQVAKEIRKLARCIPNTKLVVLCGGSPVRHQATSLANGAHIAVGTPGRINDLIQRNHLSLSQLKVLVLDEADRMLDMGFQEELNKIVAKAPKQRQSLLFSATYPESIKNICIKFLNQPQTVTVDSTDTNQNIHQSFFSTTHKDRNDSVLALFEHHNPASTLVFCRTKIDCRQLAKFLQDNRISALAIHGDLEQRERDEVLARFSNGSCPVLVATDVAARGLDIKSLACVINYELPHDPEDFTHRIGRTGRAGEQGIALSLVTEAEQNRLNNIETAQNTKAPLQAINTLNRQPRFSLYSDTASLKITLGKKHKIRAGDILGALTKEAGIAGDQIGKINIFMMFSVIAIKRSSIKQAVEHLEKGRIKKQLTRAFELH